MCIQAKHNCYMERPKWFRDVVNIPVHQGQQVEDQPILVKLRIGKHEQVQKPEEFILTSSAKLNMLGLVACRVIQEGILLRSRPPGMPARELTVVLHPRFEKPDEWEISKTSPGNVKVGFSVVHDRNAGS